MLSFAQVIILSALALTACAAPHPFIAGRHAPAVFCSATATCMTDAQASQVGGFWTTLIGSYTQQFADSVFLPTFSDYYDSALSLNTACPQTTGPTPALLNAVFKNRDEFEAGQGPQPSIQSTRLQVLNGCSEVTMRYEMTNLGTRPVVGLIVMDVVPASSGSAYPFQISTMWSEFDVGAWTSNLKDAGKC